MRTLTSILAATIAAGALAAAPAASAAMFAPEAGISKTRCATNGTTKATLRLDNTDSRKAVTYEVVSGDARYVTVPARTLVKHTLTIKPGTTVRTRVSAFDARIATYATKALPCPTARLGKTNLKYAAPVRFKNPTSKRITFVLDTTTSRGDMTTNIVRVRPGKTETVWVGAEHDGTRVVAYLGERKMLDRLAI